jgi:hypothetical protein
MSLFKTEEQEGKSGPVWGLVPAGGEYGGNITYSNMKMEK